MKMNSNPALAAAVENLAAARQQREAARQAIANATDKAARVNALHARLEAAQATIATLTQQHAAALNEWAAAGATGTPPAADAKALRDAHAELAGAQQQDDAAALAVKAADGEYLELVARYPDVQQGVTDCAVGVAYGEIQACRASRQTALDAWNVADARCEKLTQIIMRLAQTSAPARAALRELDAIRAAEIAAGRKEQDLAMLAARESALAYWEALIG